MREAVRKLKIENYKDKLIPNKPNNVSDFEAMSFDENIMKAKYDPVAAFVFSLDEFLQRLKTIIDKDLPNPDGYAYFVNPKKGNKEYAERHRLRRFFRRSEHGQRRICGREPGEIRQNGRLQRYFYGHRAETPGET